MNASAPTLIEPMRDVMGRALYEEPAEGPPRSWYDLSEIRREPWRKDADRIIEALKQFAPHFAEYCYGRGGVDWLALTPNELWTDFLDDVQQTNGPRQLRTDETTAA